MSDSHKNWVEFESVNKTYDGKNYAVRDLNLSIRKGEFITLLGPSGSGKSTTLSLLAGFEKPTDGKIRHNGRDLEKLPPYKRNFGMVFQNYALFPHMNISENIAFPLSMRKLGKSVIDEKVAKVLELVKLKGFENRMPSQLSGGQQQRVALARALVFNPEIVLMDEPLGALDKRLRERMQIEIKRMHENLGVTFVFVTHDQDEALTMSDRIAVYSQGKIQQIAIPGVLYEEPESAFVANFLGDTNILRGKVVGVDPDFVSVVLSEGTQIQAKGVSPVKLGDSVLVSIRPERINTCSEISAAGNNQICVGKPEKIYRGSHVSLIYQTSAGQSITAVFDAEEYQPGETESHSILSFESKYARVFAED